jgi:hypothetical protein
VALRTIRDLLEGYGPCLAHPFTEYRTYAQQMNQCQCPMIDPLKSLI